MTDFMHRKHAAVQTSRETILSIAARATRRPIDSLERIIQGYDSEVYRANIAGGEALIVRIQRFGEVSYAAEAWAIEACREAGAPVPEILLLDRLSLAEGDCDFMVQRALAGRPLSAIQDHLTGAELAFAWARAGEALARIHSVPAGGFYKMRQPGVWDFPDWASISRTATDDRAVDLEQLRQQGVDPADLTALQEMLSAHIREFPCARPLLLHGNFLPDHLFFDDSLRLTGIIDFGDFQGGARINDFALLQLEMPELNLLWIRDGYGAQDPFDECFERRLLLTMAELTVGYLAHYLRQHNHEEAAPLLPQIRQLSNRWHLYDRSRQ